MLVHSIQLFWSKVSFRVLEEISWHIVQNLAHEFSNFLGLILLERTLCVVTAAHEEDDCKRFRESVHTLLVVVEERLDDAFIEGDWIVRLLNVWIVLVTISSRSRLRAIRPSFLSADTSTWPI